MRAEVVVRAEGEGAGAPCLEACPFLVVPYLAGPSWASATDVGVEGVAGDGDGDNHVAASHEDAADGEEALGACRADLHRAFRSEEEAADEVDLQCKEILDVSKGYLITRGAVFVSVRKVRKGYPVTFNFMNYAKPMMNRLTISAVSVSTIDYLTSHVHHQWHGRTHLIVAAVVIPT